MFVVLFIISCVLADTPYILQSTCHININAILSHLGDNMALVLV